MATDNQIEKFWKEKEEALGGKVLFQTYVTYVGEAGSGLINGRGGLFYIVGDCLYFEDFEKHNALMALFNRKDSSYEKTEFSLPLEDIRSVQRVAEKDARACVGGIIDENSLPSLGKLRSLFTRGYWRLSVHEKASLFFEIMDDTALFRYLPALNS